MPLGNPLVPVPRPKDGDEKEPEIVWTDLRETLARRRFLFLGEELKNKPTNDILALMTYLNLEDPTRSIFLFINSPGGSIRNGIALVDHMQTIEAEVHTFCIGLAASMAAFVLLGGQKNERAALPHARIMMHEPVCEPYKDTPSKCLMHANEFKTMRESVVTQFAERTGQPRSVIIEDMKRSRCMSSEEAQAYGIIDRIALKFPTLSEDSISIKKDKKE